MFCDPWKINNVCLKNIKQLSYKIITFSADKILGYKSNMQMEGHLNLSVQSLKLNFTRI